MPDSGSQTKYKYPGTRDAIDGNTAVIMVEREASHGAGAYPITPSTQMGEYWAEEVAKGHLNTAGQPLIFVEPESEHAAAGVTAGMSMTGMRAVNFTSAQGLAFMHESLYAAVGKRLTYVLNLGCRAITKASLNVHCAHDDYHCADDTGFIQVFAKNAQEAADLNMIARKTAELALTPAMVGQDGFLTTHLIEPMMVPERELVAEYLGCADDIIDTPTPAQKMLYGPKRRRIPAIWDVDNPMQTGIVANQDAYMQAVAAQRPYFFAHIPALTDQCMEEFHALTGRRYSRVAAYRCDDADYIILGQGSMTVQAEAVADWMRENRKIKVGVVNLTMFRPFPGDLLGKVLKGKKGVAVLERTDQPMSEDLPLMREVRSTITKCVENARENSYADYACYESAKDMPSLYSGCYGLGSRDLQPEGLIAAVENMLPGAAHRKFYYLSVDFLRDESANPKQEIHQQKLKEAYPRIKEMALRGSENPNLLPKNAIAVRMHSIGGWGMVTTGKNLAMTLFELLGWDIKANPKYGSEKKGQPTTYYLSAAPEPIRINCEYTRVDVVMSPDPQVFGHTNAVEGLNQGGVFIIQSSLDSAEALWETFPMHIQKYIFDNKIRVFYLDAFKIAREESSNVDLQLRMQGNAFQGAFFRASDVKERAGLSEETLFTAIENQLEDKFGKKGKRIVEDNLRVVRRGYEEMFEIKPEQMKVGQRAKVVGKAAPVLPIMLKQLPEGDGGVSDVHRFWEQTGSFYMKGQGSDNLVDPFIGLSVIPAVTGVYRDMTGVRFEHPEWKAENCTACGECYTVCPDSAIPGLVSTSADVLNTAIQRIETGGHPTRFLRKFSRTIDKKLRGALDKDGIDVRAVLANAITEAFAADPTQGDDRVRLEAELNLLRAEIGSFKFATTKPYWTQKEKKEKGAGGLFSITINPYTCKGCALCVEVCGDNALTMVPQTAQTIETMRDDWNFWLDLPTTLPQFSRIDDLDEKVGALETLLLDKHNYLSMVSGDGACLGCGEKSTIHLFTSTVTALMQPRVKKFLGKLDTLIAGLENHIRMKLSATVDLTDTQALMQAVQANKGHDLTLANLSESLLAKHPGQPIDPQWLKRVSQMLEKLKDLRWRYMEGPSKHGRSEMGIVNSTGCTSVWASTYPFNPYPFPWTSHLFQDSPSVAMGIFEGHMCAMVEGFKTVRQVEMELAGGYDPDRERRLLCALQLGTAHRRRMASVPAGPGNGRRRRDVRHRLPEPVACTDVGQAGQDPDRGHAGVFQHRRPGLYLRLHRPGGRHVALRFQPARQEREAQGDQRDRHGAPHRVRGASVAGQYHAYAGKLHRRHQHPPSGTVQRVCGLPAGTRRGRQQRGGAQQDGDGIARLPAVPLQPRPGRDLLRVRHAGRQSRAGCRLADLRSRLCGREGRQEDDDDADDVCRFRPGRRTLRQAVQEGAAGNLERRHGVAGRFPQAVRGRARRQVPVHLVGGQEEPPDARADVGGDGAFLRRTFAVLAPAQGRGQRRWRASR